MPAQFTTVVKFNDFPKIAKALPEQTSKVVRKTALDIEGRAKANVRSVGAIDTGALLNSIRAREESKLSWVIAPGVGYAIYVEYGTYRMAARPYLIPAAEAVKGAYVKALEQLLKGLGK